MRTGPGPGAAMLRSPRRMFDVPMAGGGENVVFDFGDGDRLVIENMPKSNVSFADFNTT